MIDILMHELSGKSSLLTRETADQILSKIEVAQVDSGSPIVVDFNGVLAVTPSFLDQFPGGLKLMVSARHSDSITMRFLQVPTHASTKFVAVGRSHKMMLQEQSDREWLLVESRE